MINRSPYISISTNCLGLKLNMDAGDHVNTQLFIITVIREKLSDYYYYSIF